MLLDWTLKRVLKFILKRTLGRYLKTEVDLDQIDVQLGKGTLELQNVLLNCDNINQQLALQGWEVKAGYVGSIRASIPLTSGGAASSNNLTAAGASSANTSSGGAAGTAAAAAAAGGNADVCLNEVYITVAPVPPGRVPPAGATPSAAGPMDAEAAGLGTLDGWEQLSSASLAGLSSDPLQFVQDMGLGLGQAGVLEGIRRIAGGLENMLQRLSAVATSITIRVEVPAAATAGTAGNGAWSEAAAAAAGCSAGDGAAGGVELVLNIGRLAYNDATPNQAAPALSPMAVAFSQTGAATAGAAAATELVKHLQVQGVTLEVLPWTPEEVTQQESTSFPAAAGSPGGGGGGTARPAAASNAMSDMRASFMLDAAAAAAARQQLAAEAGRAAGAGPAATAASPDPSVQGVVLGAPHGTGLGASMELKLTWLDAAHTIPQITAELALTPVKVQLQPWQLPLLQLLPGALAGPPSSTSGQQGGVGTGTTTSSSSLPSGARGGSLPTGVLPEDQLPPDVPAPVGPGEDWGRRSLVQDLFFPQCRGFVADSLLYDATGGTGSTWGARSGYWSNSTAASTGGIGAAGSMYEDARSFMTGIASSMLASSSSSSSRAGGGGFFSGVVNTMSNTLGGWAGYAPGLGLGSAGAGGSSNVGTTAAAAAAAAVPQPPDAWSVRLSLPELTAVLWYHDPAAPGGVASSRSRSSCSRPDYGVPPRLVLECGGLVASADLQGSAVQADFKAYQLEVSEHLPGSFSAPPSSASYATSPRSSMAGCGGCGDASSCWGAAPAARSPAEYAQVPRHLPAAEQGCRPVPLYGQAASSAGPAVMGPAGVEGVVVWPLLCWGGRPLETRSVPSITRPCINVQVSGQLPGGQKHPGGFTNPSSRLHSVAHHRHAHSSSSPHNNSSSSCCGLSQLAVAVDLLPLTLWLSSSAITRISSIITPMNAATDTAAAASSNHAVQQQLGAGRSPGVNPVPASGSTGVDRGVVPSGRVSPSQVEHVIDSILQDLQGMSGGGHGASKRVHYSPGVTGVTPVGDPAAPWGPRVGGTGAGQQQGGGRVGSSTPAAAGASSLLTALSQMDFSSTLHLQHVCVVLALPAQHQQGLPAGVSSSSSIREAVQGTSGGRSSTQYLVLDFFSGSSAAVTSPATATATTIARSLPLLRCVSVAAKSNSSGTTGTGSITASGHHLGSALRWPFSAGSSQTQPATAAVPLTAELCLTRARAYLVGDALAVQLAGSTGRGATSSTSSGVGRMQTTCIFDAAPGLYGQSMPGPASGHTSGSSSRGEATTATSHLSHASNPGSAATPAAAADGAAGPTAAAASSAAGAAVGFGADDHPPGTAIFAEVSFDPGATVDPALLTDALDVAAAHARDKFAPDGACQGGGWGMMSELGSSPGGAFGLLQLQDRCKHGSATFCHVRAPRLTSSLARPDLLTVLEGLTAWGSKAPAEAAPKAPAAAGDGSSSSSGRAVSTPQVTLLVQCRLRCNLQAPAAATPSTPASPAAAAAGLGTPGVHSPSYDFTAYEVTVDDFTALHVMGVGGCSSATASCLSLHNVQLLTGQNKTVALLLPASSSRSTAPVLEMLQVRPGSAAAAAAAAGAGPSWQPPSGTALTDSQRKALTNPEGITSVLLQGATLALDEGSLGAKWVTGLVDFFSAAPSTSSSSSTAAAVQSSRDAGVSTNLDAPAATAAAATATAAGHDPASTAPGSSTSTTPAGSNLVVNIRDLGVRYEPSSAGIQTHNSSRIAAALVVEGVHWALTPGPSSRQLIALSALSFFVAPAAGRTGGGTTGWSTSAARDLPGVNLVNHGYHCLVQEGGLRLQLRPDRHCSRHQGGHSTWEVVVTNQHLVGALHQDSAVLLLQLVNQVRADLLLAQQQQQVEAIRASKGRGRPPAAGARGSGAGAGAGGLGAAAPASPGGAGGSIRTGGQATGHGQRMQQMGIHSSSPGAWPNGHFDAAAAAAAAGLTGGGGAAGSSSGSGSSAAIPVMQQIQEDVFRMAAPAADLPPASPPSVSASVYLNGGWYPQLPGRDMGKPAAKAQLPLRPSPAAAAAPGCAGPGQDGSAALGGSARGVVLGLESEGRQNSLPAAGGGSGLGGVLLEEDPAAAGGETAGSSGKVPLYPAVPPPEVDLLGDIDRLFDHAPQQLEDQAGVSPQHLTADAWAAGQFSGHLCAEDLARSILPCLGAQPGPTGLEVEVPSMVPVLMEDFYPPQQPPSTAAAGYGAPDGDAAYATAAAAGGGGISSSHATGRGAGGGWQMVERGAVCYSCGPRLQAPQQGVLGSTGPVVHVDHIHPQHGPAAVVPEPPSPAECPQQGQWYASAPQPAGMAGGHTGGAASAAAPAATDMDVDFDRQQAAAAASAGVGVLELQEDYVPQPPAPESSSDDGWQQGRHGVAGCSAGSGADGGWLDTLGGTAASSSILQHMCPCDASVPCPISRIMLKGISGMWVLHEASSSSSLAGRGLSKSGSKGRSKPSRSAKGGGTEGRVELEVDGVNLTIVNFPAGGNYVSRCSVVIGSVEVRDCGATAAGGGGSKWVKILSVRRPGQPGGQAAAVAAAATAAAAPLSPAGMTAVTGDMRVPNSSAGLADLVCSHIPESLRSSAVAAASTTSSSYLSQGVASNSGAYCATGSSSSGMAPVGGGAGGAAAAGTAAASAAAGSGNLLPPGWPAAVAAPGQPLPALALVLDTVCPDPAAAPEVEEYRLTVALLPVRLKLDQDLVAFLTAFSSAVSSAVAAVDNPVAAALAATGAEAPAPPYFQKVEVWGTGVMLDYRPRRVNIAALREGDFVELLNLVPWGGVDLSLKPLRLIGLEGWDGVGAAAAMEWLQHAARTQAHKFLTGVAPIRSVVRVGGAVAGLLAVPAAHISSAVARRGCSSLAAAAASASSSNASDALRKSTVSFVRALVFEALGLGATVAAGAQVVLAGGLPVAMEAPSGLLEGLRAAAGELKGGLGAAADVLVRGPVRSMREGGASWQQAASRALRAAPAAAGTSAQAAAAAVRYTLLGVQCALDPDKRLEQ